MPELPEVETIRRDLQRQLRGRILERVVVRKPKLVRGSVAPFRRVLAGAEMARWQRRGKLLSVSFANRDEVLLLHLKMTGQLIFVDGTSVVAGGHSHPVMDTLPNKYSHLIFHFTDGSTLYFNDLRQFGYAQLVPATDVPAIHATYGVEPLSRKFTVAALTALLHEQRRTLKEFLLDQRKIAGLGNIYVDEACWRARVLPTRRAGSLSPAEIRALYRAIQSVLTLSLKHRGTTFNSYRDSRGRRGTFLKYLRVYGRAGKPCYRCGRDLTRIVVGGRGTVLCTACQV